MLLDEVDGEPVAAGRDRAAQRELCRSVSPGATARSSGVRGLSQTIALPRSSSQWYARNEAVLGAAGAPGRRACVLDLDRRVLQRARLDGRALERAPARDEGAGVACMAGASLGR